MCYSVMVQQDLKKLSADFNASLDNHAFELYRHQISKSKKVKLMSEHSRIYPNYWAPIVCSDLQYNIKPMRYRLRPAWSLDGEVPSKYNLFNARIDSLDKRKSWQTIFMKNHGVIVIENFFEWVVRSGKKQVVSFRSEEARELYVPVVWDSFKDSNDHGALFSFAILTTQASPEILAAGHDRCPVHLDRTAVDVWLNPKDHRRADMYNLLENHRQHVFSCHLASI